MPPNFWMSSVCSRIDRVDHVVDGDDAEDVIGVVDHRHGEQVVLGDQPGHILAGQVRRHRERRPFTRDAANGGTRLGEHEVAQRHHVHEPSSAGR